MYIIYSLESVGAAEEEAAGDQSPFERYSSLKDKMAMDTHRDSREKIYTPATGLSLLVFYALAMQCMSTLVVVKNETGRWRWAVLQFMGSLAYVLSWITYMLVNLIA